MLSLALCLLSSAPTLPAPQDVAPPVRTRIDYRASPFVDMHFWVRDLASRTDALPKVEGIAAAIAAVKELDEELGGGLAWGAIEGRLGEYANAAAAREGSAQFPEATELRSGKSLELRKCAHKLAEALALVEPAFLASVWPEHEHTLDAARETFGDLLTPKESVALEFLTKHLGLSDDGHLLPVYLVVQAPYPGAVTHRDHSGRGVCFVAVKGVKPTLLVETALHELTHAFDVADKGDSVLAKLRKALEAKGFTARDKEWRDVPHTLMFVNAGEAVRRVIDPAHVHYGQAAGYYKKVAAIAELELPIWTAHLDGKQTREQAIEAIVAGVKLPNAK